MKRTILLLALLVGCTGVKLTTPPGFAELGKSGPFVYRATTANGVVMGVRVAKNQPRGNLDFWSTAVDRKLAGDGYVLEERKAVRSKSGMAGTMLKYTLDSTRYHVAVYATADKVYVVDAAGEAEAFDPLAATIETAELSIH